MGVHTDRCGERHHAGKELCRKTEPRGNTPKEKSIYLVMILVVGTKTRDRNPRSLRCDGRPRNRGWRTVSSA